MPEPTLFVTAVFSAGDDEYAPFWGVITRTEPKKAYNEQFHELLESLSSSKNYFSSVYWRSNGSSTFWFLDKDIRDTFVTMMCVRFSDVEVTTEEEYEC